MTKERKNNYLFEVTFCRTFQISQIITNQKAISISNALWSVEDPKKLKYEKPRGRPTGPFDILSAKSK